MAAHEKAQALDLLQARNKELRLIRDGLLTSSKVADTQTHTHTIAYIRPTSW